MSASASPPSPWDDAGLAAALFAVDPHALGGIALRARVGPVRSRFLEQTLELRDRRAPLRKLPVHISEDRLLGGLDLGATLKAGRPVASHGVLAEAHGGIILASMAERLAPLTVSRLSASLDDGRLSLQREGLAQICPARFGVIALDEGCAPDEALAPALADRLAFAVDLTAIGLRAAGPFAYRADQVAAARARLPAVAIDDADIRALCLTAAALGVASLRAVQLAAKAARTLAALHGRPMVDEDDLSAAARLVLAARATRLPMDDQADPPPPARDDEPANDLQEPLEMEDIDRALEDIVLAAAAAAIPAHVLESLKAGATRGRQRQTGQAGAMQSGAKRGRPSGVRRMTRRDGHRVNVIETLRAAAPWQPVRRRSVAAEAPTRVLVQPGDLRITRCKHRSESVVIFAVDASGSSALHRLAEAKGAVELLLADCYVRREQVALIAFRGGDADLLLPPTRSLVRAKRALAGLPGGGGTPLARGLDLAADLADAVKRKGQSALVVLLTDGRANIGRNGMAGRAQAESDARAAAARVRHDQLACLLIDTAPRPHAFAAALAEIMAARYLPMPYADAEHLSAAVRAQSA